MSEPRIIVFDIETMPNWPEVLKYFCGLSEYPGKTLKAQINTIICCGWKVVGESKVHCLKSWDYADDINDDKQMCQEMYDVLSKADAVVTHNGKRFDWKFLQTRLLKHKLPLLHKIPHIDTCMLARANLTAFNNRLQTLSKLIGAEGKLQHGGGWKLWEDVFNGNKSARKKMVEYCKQDVQATEDLFLPLRPFASNIPNYNIFTNLDVPVCPSCGGTILSKNGIRHTATRSYQRFTCHNCGSSARGDMKERNLRAI